MAYRTFGDLSTQLKSEIDLEDEEFVQPAELIGYFNTGITIIESEILKLGLREQYLKSETFISVVSGQEEYDLPADIVDTKIRKIVYRNGPTIYTVNPMRGEDSFEGEDMLNQYNTSSEYYRWDIYKLTDEYTLRLIPTPQLSVTNGLRVLYWKDLNRYVSDSTNCDVPTVCYEFLLSYVRYRIYMKETHVNTPGEKEDMNSMLNLLRETLSGQIADPTIDLVDQDLTIYEEMS